jgi:hypothetical protein
MHNWKTIWDEIKASSPRMEWDQMGFQRTAETYYDAVLALIRVFVENVGRLPSIPSDCEKGSHLKRVLSL